MRRSACKKYTGKFTRQLRKLTDQPNLAPKWELVGDATWEDFRNPSGRTRAVAQIELEGRTYWVEARMADNFLGLILGALVMSAASPLFGTLLSNMLCLGGPEPMFSIFTEDPRICLQQGRTVLIKDDMQNFLDAQRANLALLSV